MPALQIFRSHQSQKPSRMKWETCTTTDNFRWETARALSQLGGARHIAYERQSEFSLGSGRRAVIASFSC